MKNTELIKQWKSTTQNNYGVPSIALVKGKGIVVTDADGKQYLDFLGGIATSILGHAHPAIVKAVSKQIAQLSHVSNFYAHPNAVALAAKLIDMTGDKSARVFFCQSGAEANEAAGVKHVAFGDIEAMRRAISRKTAMVILEPIMGEAGVIIPPVDYLSQVRELCDRYGALLVIDAVQTGMGRTGDWFGFEYSGIKPDVITLAKGLGGGLPLGAMIALGKAASLFEAGDHGTTFGGNPVTTAAGLAAIAVIEKEKLIEKSVLHHEYLLTELAMVKGVKEVRGAGLLIGIELDTPTAKEFAAKMAKAGVLVNAANESTIRIAPALIVTQAQLVKFVSIFRKVISDGK